MRTLKEIRGRCVIEDGHWLWKGALRPDGRPNIYAPDYTYGGSMRVQSGMRAVWHCAHKQPIPAGWRTYAVCGEPTCCNPAHIRCTSAEEYGQWVKSEGRDRGKTSRILINRRINRARSKLNGELIAEIQASSETGRALAARMGVSEQTISKARKGDYISFAGADRLGMFSGLITVGSGAARV